MKDHLTFYDIHGFVTAVDPYVNGIFLKEYGFFRTTKDNVENVDLYVKVWKGNKILPTRRAGGLRGLLLPLRPDENTLWYNFGMDATTVLEYCEALMWWEDKTFFHAGAIGKNEEAFIFTGGGGVGKTSLVLNFLRRGYKYLGDDWILLGKQGIAYPLPKRIHIFDYNLKDEEIARKVLGSKRYYYSVLFGFFKVGERVAPNRYVRFLFQRFRPHFKVPIQKLFQKVKIAPPSSVSRVFFLERKDLEGEYIEVNKEVTNEEIATRLAFVNLFERNGFFREYYRYAYEFGVRNTKIEEKFNHDFNILLEAFKKTEIYRVYIPGGLDLTSFDLQSLLQENIKEKSHFPSNNFQ
ncbi:MAG: hypothetical protein ACFFCW_26735 [Candidatus Hodarchaeota archaeon]